MRRLVALLLLPLLSAACLSLTGCGEKSSAPAFMNTDVTGLEYAKDFSLKDFNGRLRTLADFKGKVVIIFFGYTQCPVVCPTTMSDLVGAMKQLGPLSDKVQVLFITVDPERDTPPILAQYVPAFDARFLGLAGDLAATAKVAKEFRVFYQKVPGKDPGSYTMDHTAGLYIYDREGRLRLFVRNGQGIDPLVHDLRILLS
ncbi:MAG: SCO family protein [Burkholderiales bacterium]